MAIENAGQEAPTADLNAATEQVEAQAAQETAKEVPPEPVATEVKPAEVKPAETPRVRKSDEFAAKAALEKQKRQFEANYKAKVAELEKMKQEVQAFQQKLGDPRQDPIGYLERMGIPTDVIVQQLTNRPPPKPEDAVNRLRQEMEEKLRLAYEKQQRELQAQRQVLEQSQKQQYERELDQFNKQAINFVNNAGDKYELIQAYGAQDYVPQLILSYAKEHGKELTFEEAANLIEQDLEEQSQKVIATKKIKSKVQPVQQPAAKSGGATASVTNLASASSAGVANQRELSDDEAYRQALELIRNAKS